MHWIRFLILILIAAIIQTSLVNALALTGAQVKPNLLLILMVFFSIHCTAQEAIVSAFVIGLFADLIGAGMGPQLLAFGVIGSLISEVRHVMVMRHIPQQMIAVFAAGFLCGLTTLVLSQIKNCPLPTRADHLILWQPLYSACLAGPLFWVIQKILPQYHAKHRSVMS
ncbi:MAG: rod shape-determining protein MreD [Planctomycetes bacterium]|nr:rod shape-determining protein MreD [Planctomycetota bacterium]